MKIKKAKRTKKCVIKRKLKFEDYINCLEATQLENKIKQLEKNENDLNGLEKDHNEFIKKKLNLYKLILTQERFKSERHVCFTEEINKITLI